MKRSAPDKTHTDRALWDKVTATIRPLDKRKAKIAPPAPPRGRDIAIPPRETDAPRSKQALGELHPHKVENVDGALTRRLRAGELPIAGRIDLHGLTRAEAEAALTRFVHFSYHNGRRCVLVITGRSGILKPATIGWLNEPALRPYVLAVAPAKKHGGDGAYYVLLKRRK